MTTGNSSLEILNTQKSTPEQVSEFCLLHSRGKHFILADMEWLFELFQNPSDENDEQSPLNYLKTYIKFEDFLNLCLTEKDTDFVYDIIQPSLDDNTMASEFELKMTALAENLYYRLHEQLNETMANTVVGDNIDGDEEFRLLGFFLTTAVISIEPENTVKYPTFEEAYGNFGIDKWKDTSSRVPVFQTTIPFIQREYCSTGIF